MKRAIIAIVLVALLAAAGWYGWSNWPEEKPERWLGYIEGEALNIAPPVSGTLATRTVERGARVVAGQSLFTLNAVITDSETERLQAQLAAAQADVANLRNTRQRPPEIRVSQAQQAAARAEIERTRKQYDRYAVLATKGFVTRAQLDAAKAAYEVAQASFEQARAQEASGKLTIGRDDELRAANANVAAIQAAIKAQKQRRTEIAPTSPANGVVEQTFFNPGEWVTANASVVSIIADDRRKLRFFVPEARLVQMKTGMAVHFTCDGCPEGLSASVSYISPRAEFTPPVIYSERARAKLVFLVEARLPPTAEPLPLGLPVEIVPPGP